MVDRLRAVYVDGGASREMSTDSVCLTVDVEDWYEGMAVLGEPVPRPPDARSGLSDLVSLLATSRGSTVTLFVVGNYAATVAAELAELAGAGHEIASHGPDHGRLPEERAALVDWLRRGREMVEDRLQEPVRGFRSPRFDFPTTLGLAGFRDALAEAGFGYVSDTHRLGDGSPIRELPVLTTHGFPIGGGSYQRVATAGRATCRGGLLGRTLGALLPFLRLRGDPPARTRRPFAGSGQAGARAQKDRHGVLTGAQPVWKQGMWSCRAVTSRPTSTGAQGDSPPSTRASRSRGSSVGDRSSTGSASRSRCAIATGAKRVLDVGCGSGPLFAPLASKGIHVTGIDPAEAMVELAARTGGGPPRDWSKSNVADGRS